MNNIKNIYFVNKENEEYLIKNPIRFLKLQLKPFISDRIENETEIKYNLYSEIHFFKYFVPNNKKTLEIINFLDTANEKVLLGENKDNINYLNEYEIYVKNLWFSLEEPVIVVFDDDNFYLVRNKKHFKLFITLDTLDNSKLYEYKKLNVNGKLYNFISKTMPKNNPSLIFLKNAPNNINKIETLEAIKYFDENEYLNNLSFIINKNRKLNNESKILKNEEGFNEPKIVFNSELMMDVFEYFMVKRKTHIKNKYFDKIIKDYNFLHDEINSTSFDNLKINNLFILFKINKTFLSKNLTLKAKKIIITNFYQINYDIVININIDSEYFIINNDNYMNNTEIINFNLLDKVKYLVIIFKEKPNITLSGGKFVKYVYIKINNDYGFTEKNLLCFDKQQCKVFNLKI